MNFIFFVKKIDKIGLRKSVQTTLKSTFYKE